VVVAVERVVLSLAMVGVHTILPLVAAAVAGLVQAMYQAQVTQVALLVVR
jgi:hypothetical protein